MSKHVTFSEQFTAKALTPIETLAAGSGVCLEFASLTCALINIVEPGKCWVVVGQLGNASTSGHAWIEADGIPYEPQSGESVAHDSDEGYHPWFKYNEKDYERLDPKAPMDRIREFILTGGTQVTRAKLWWW